MKLSTKRINNFRNMILDWWPPHCRDLPWRRTRDPYRIMVSEVMLQQTQVLRIIAKYTEFIEVFPTVFDLAKARPADVLRVWKGMGYNRRALYLHRTARIICDQYNGYFPINYSQLTALPGLGTYTARAILVFAHGQEVPLVDTNIRQIITHFFFTQHPECSVRKHEDEWYKTQSESPQCPDCKPKHHPMVLGKVVGAGFTKQAQGRALEKEVEDIARQLIPPGKSWEWHQALMDYGAIELQKVNGKRKMERRETIPFRDSNRFYRGRIIDRLREGDIKESTFIRILEKTYDKPLSFFQSILHGLEADGLIARSKTGIISLPN